MSDDQKLYTIKEAAQFLGVSVRTLKRWRKSGKLVPEIKGDNGRRGGRGKGDKYTLEQLKRVTHLIEKKGDTCNITGDNEEKTRNRLPVPQPLVTRLLKGGTTTEVSMPTEKTTSSVEVEEFYFDDDDIVVINDSFKANLPAEYRQNLTKLFGKFTIAPIGEFFATEFNSTKTLMTYAKLDYENSGVKFDKKFDKMHELILNSLYSFSRAENILFTSRNILQHFFGNVSDHFQSGLVKSSTKNLTSSDA